MAEHKTLAGMYCWILAWREGATDPFTVLCASTRIWNLIQAAMGSWMHTLALSVHVCVCVCVCVCACVRACVYVHHIPTNSPHCLRTTNIASIFFIKKQQQYMNLLQQHVLNIEYLVSVCVCVCKLKYRMRAHELIYPYQGFG